ncbi:MAG: hypothetical protein F6K42_28875, partial [Leptolyngbya sp. SIO1D8]|nr:hypothetical protein [Leptolyngbya sp. SIO1D8]
SEASLGGHLACTQDTDYLAEHGFHALFDCYREVLPLLERIGAMGNFTIGPKHLFLWGNQQLHYAHPHQMIFSSAFNWEQRWELPKFIALLLKHQMDVSRDGFDSLNRYDTLDFREYLRREGIAECLVNSPLVKMYYDFGFNGFDPMSAAVGLKNLLFLTAKPQLYQFEFPATQALLAPLIRYFQQQCRGQIRYHHHVDKIHWGEANQRITALDVHDTATGRSYRHSVDIVVLAVGLEAFKHLISGIPHHDSLWPHVQTLEAVPSVSLQAWFKEDPVPRHINSVIAGLPEPLSVVAPLTRLRRHPSTTPLPYEIIAVGPERGFEQVEDEVLIESFWQRLRHLGFRIPHAPAEKYVHFHRNRAASQRYLLTRPGQLSDRPLPVTQIPNLFLAGAWLQTTFSIPSLEAAAETAKASAIGIRKLVRREGAISISLGMPKTHPLVTAPTYHLREVRARFFVVPLQREMVQCELPACLQEVPALAGYGLLTLMDYQRVYSEHDQQGLEWSYQEVVLNAFVEERHRPGLDRLGLYPLAIYLNSDVAMAAGREVYGFPKKLAEIELGTHHVQLRRAGRFPNEGPGPVYPMNLVQGEWQPSTTTAAERPFWEPLLTQVADQLIPQLFNRLPALPFYLHQVFVAPGARQHSQTTVSRVLRVPVNSLQIHRSRQLSQGQFRVTPSSADPLYRFVPTPNPTWTADTGLELDLEFTLSTAEEIAKYGHWTSSQQTSSIPWVPTTVPVQVTASTE